MIDRRVDHTQLLECLLRCSPHPQDGPPILHLVTEMGQPGFDLISLWGSVAVRAAADHVGDQYPTPLQSCLREDRPQKSPRSPNEGSPLPLLIGPRCFPYYHHISGPGISVRRNIY